MPNIHELIKGSGPIYVKNTTSRLHNGQGMKLMLVFKDIHGNSSTVMIPNMKYPIDLASRVPRNRIVESTDFMRLLHAGGLELVDPQAAESLLSRPGAQEAIAREYGKSNLSQKLNLTPARERYGLRTKDEGKHDPELAETDGIEWRDDDEDAMMAMQLAAIDPNAPDMLRDAEITKAKLKMDTSVNARVLNLIGTLEADPASKQDVLADLDTVDEDSYTQEDLSYILDRARAFPAITSWARQLMASRQLADEQHGKRRRRR